MKRGFTLLEVMISLAIMGMVMATVMETVNQTRSAVDAIHNIMETENTGPRILQTIRQDLEALAIYDAAEYKVFKGVNQTQMGAEADRIDLIVRKKGTVPVDLPTRMETVFAPFNEVGYRLRQNPLRPDFLELYRREDSLVDEDPFRDGTFTLVYDRIISLDIRYAEEPENQIVWLDSWDSYEREGLPFAIEIYLEIEIQPRRSLESLNILGANLARLEYTDVIHIPEETRWRFRNRLHPELPGDTADDPGQAVDQNGNPIDTTNGLGNGSESGSVSGTGTDTRGTNSLGG
ncbi:MAG: prepilin-type N-terminal cleavage/methylation domain-containing protein [Planctomycetota bacterium]